MYILLLNTSQPNAQVVLLRDGGLLAQKVWPSTPLLGRALLNAVDEVLHEHQLTLPDLDRIAVHRGPGHYSALRTGVVSAAMLAQAAGVPLVSVAGDDQASIVAAAQHLKPQPVIQPQYSAS